MNIIILDIIKSLHIYTPHICLNISYEREILCHVPKVKEEQKKE